MRRTDKDGFFRIYEKANFNRDRGKYKKGASYFSLAAEAAHDLGDLRYEVHSVWGEGECYRQMEDYEKALAKYTWIISKMEGHQGSEQMETDVVSVIIRSFCDWVRCAAKIASFDGQNLIEVFDAGERYMVSTGHSQVRADFLHTKAISLMALYQLKPALVIAEEGLALKRMNPGSPGCGLYHHLEVYGELLRLLEKDAEAMAVINEAIDLRPSGGGVWAERGYLHMKLGDYPAAIRDFTEAAYLDGKASRYKMRALAYALSGDRETAVEDLRQALREDRDDIYSALWLAGIGKSYARLRRFADSPQWSANVAKFYLGEIGQGELLRLAAETGPERKRIDNLCESHTSIAIYQEGRGDMESARRHYELSVATEAVNKNCHLWARRKLAQMG